MSEPENKKPPVSKLAIFAFLLALFGLIIIAALIILQNIELNEVIEKIAVTTIFLSLSAGLAFGIISLLRIIKNKGTLRGTLLSLSAVIISVLVIMNIILPFPPVRRIPMSIICGINLSCLEKAVFLYANDFNDRYPDCNQWCDLIAKYEDVQPKYFLCREAVEQGDKGPCHYAMNPNCEPNSPNDIVLLFETKGGWNQYGGPELLTFDNHKKKSAAIGFNDIHVEIVKPEDVNKLKWK